MRITTYIGIFALIVFSYALFDNTLNKWFNIIMIILTIIYIFWNIGDEYQDKYGWMVEKWKKN